VRMSLSSDAFLDPPAATDLDGGKLPALYEVVDGR